jgi:hypothetical protein
VGNLLSGRENIAFWRGTILRGEVASYEDDISSVECGTMAELYLSSFHNYSVFEMIQRETANQNLYALPKSTRLSLSLLYLLYLLYLCLV